MLNGSLRKNELRLFSSMPKKDSHFMILALVAHFNIELQQIDVKTTFFIGDLENERFIYMKQLEDVS